MSILVTGSTGRVGTHVVAGLVASGKRVRALTRSPQNARFPDGVTAVEGNLLDPDSMRRALAGVKTLFLLVTNTPDELTQAINTLGLAREAGIERLVYLSVTRSREYTDVAHFTAKYSVERMIGKLDLAATILRPSYFFQNDEALEEPLKKTGLYVPPVGDKGVSMVDVRDIADAAVLELLRRHDATAPLPRETYELCGPDALTGRALASVWAETLHRDVRYGGNDLDAFEKNLKQRAPAWFAYDMRTMMRRYQDDGARASDSDIERLTALLGRPLRRYRDFALATSLRWKA